MTLIPLLNDSVHSDEKFLVRLINLRRESEKDLDLFLMKEQFMESIYH